MIGWTNLENIIYKKSLGYLGIIGWLKINYCIIDYQLKGLHL